MLHVREGVTLDVRIRSGALPAQRARELQGRQLRVLVEEARSSGRLAQLSRCAKPCLLGAPAAPRETAENQASVPVLPTVSLIFPYCLTSSTRRFRARPSSVSLEATGA